MFAEYLNIRARERHPKSVVTQRQLPLPTLHSDRRARVGWARCRRATRRPQPRLSNDVPRRHTPCDIGGMAMILGWYGRDGDGPSGVGSACAILGKTLDSTACCRCARSITPISERQGCWNDYPQVSSAQGGVERHA